MSYIFIARQLGDGGSFDDWLVNAFDENPVTSGNTTDLYFVPVVKSEQHMQLTDETSADNCYKALQTTILIRYFYIWKPWSKLDSTNELSAEWREDTNKNFRD